MTRLANTRWTALLALCAGLAGMSQAQAASPATAQRCDRQCLYGVLDGYLAALKAHAPGQVRWAAQAKSTENNVALRVGDGLWRTITGLGDYEMRFADPVTGQVAIFGVVEETTTPAPYALRLTVARGTVSEADFAVSTGTFSSIF